MDLLWSEGNVILRSPWFHGEFYVLEWVECDHTLDTCMTKNIVSHRTHMGQSISIQLGCEFVQ